jgi:hypothetical protein
MHAKPRLIAGLVLVSRWHFRRSTSKHSQMKLWCSNIVPMTPSSGRISRQ